MPSHGEGSTDGVELSELELSVGENDAEEDGIKFQSGHFEKSSSSEEEVFDAKKIAASSDESNGDSDFEIIDKEEIAKIEMWWNSIEVQKNTERLSRATLRYDVKLKENHLWSL